MAKRAAPKKLGKKLRQIRVSAGLSQTEMVAALKYRATPLRASQISTFEHGKREPNQRKTVESEIALLYEELGAIGILIAAQRKRDNLPPDPSEPKPSSNNGNGKQKRTRGTLKAAKVAAASLEEFTRSELFERVEIDQPNLTGKVRPDAQRGTIRTLIADGLIEATERKQEGEIIYKSLKK